MEPNIHKNALKFQWKKLGAKFPVTVLSYMYSLVKIALLDDALSEIFDLEASAEKGQLLPLKR